MVRMGGVPHPQVMPPPPSMRPPLVQQVISEGIQPPLRHTHWLMKLSSIHVRRREHEFSPSILYHDPNLGCYFSSRVNHLHLQDLVLLLHISLPRLQEFCKPLYPLSHLLFWAQPPHNTAKKLYKDHLEIHISMEEIFMVTSKISMLVSVVLFYSVAQCLRSALCLLLSMTGFVRWNDWEEINFFTYERTLLWFWLKPIQATSTTNSIHLSAWETSFWMDKLFVWHSIKFPQMLHRIFSGTLICCSTDKHCRGNSTCWGWWESCQKN